MSYLSETWQNLKAGVAWKGMIANFKANAWQWFLNELSPSSYTNPDHKLHWHNLATEMFGWSKHIAIGAVGAFIFRLLGISWGWAFATAVIAASIAEVVQFFIAKASFVNPLNSFLDVSFYVAGVTLFWGVLQWVK